VPSQDIVLGLYYLSIMRRGRARRGQGVRQHRRDRGGAVGRRPITLHAKIRGRYVGVDKDGKPVSKIFDTTPGRMLLGALMPKNPNLPFDVVNKLMTKKEISNTIDAVYRHCGQKETVIFCDRIMAARLHQRVQGRHLVRQGRHGDPGRQVDRIVDETSALAKDYEQQYNDGLITQGEKYNKVVDAWAKGDRPRSPTP
jgi:DNA-directed RNA polymerase subunit beta'